MKIKEKLQANKEKKEMMRPASRKYLKNGSYSVIISIVFIVIIVLINLMVMELPSKYTEIDVSEEKLYSIGDETRELLGKLDKDVTIYHIAQKGGEDEVVVNLLQKYGDESDHVKIEQKDPVVNPKFVSQYTTDNISANSVIVVCGDRSKVVDYNTLYETSIDYNTYSYNTTGFDGEGQITSAVAYVTSENLPVLYVLGGHGEAEMDPVIREDIEKANIEIRTLNLLTEGNVPEDADCLFICSPSADISEDEKTAILEYLENGGKAMIFSDYNDRTMENFDSILKNYGVERVEGIVFEGDNQYYAMQVPYYLVPDINSTEASSKVASSGYYVLAPYAQGIQKQETVRDTVTVESILTTSESAYSKTNMSSEVMEKEEGDIEGPFDLGVMITETLEDDKTTQIVYYTTANLLQNQVNQMVSGGNEQLVMESLNWMCSSEDNSMVSIPSKSLEVSYLTMTDYDASFWKICTIVLIPGFFLVTGFVVWLKRRKA